LTLSTIFCRCKGVSAYYQCGSGTHPGGGIMGASGRFAALEILKDQAK